MKLTAAMLLPTLPPGTPAIVSIWYCMAAPPADPPGTMRPKALPAICEVAIRCQSCT